MTFLHRGSWSRPFPPKKQSAVPSSLLESLSLAFGMLLMLTLMFLVLLALRILSLPISCKSLRDHATVSSAEALEVEPAEMEEGREPWVEILSWQPRVFRYHDFLAKEECRHLITLANPHMLKSTVVGDADGSRGELSSVRTSTGMFLQRGQDETIRAIEKRIADFTFIPVNHGEGLQVLHYEVGQKYDPHIDFFMDGIHTKNGGQRVATLLMYLSDVKEGGETVFPLAKVNESSSSSHDWLSECARKGLVVRPKMGDALLFFSLQPDGKTDTLSLHGGCPVIQGDKWASTKWMRVREYVF